MRCHAARLREDPGRGRFVQSEGMRGQSTHGKEVTECGPWALLRFCFSSSAAST
jgi:hypothetical protein